MRFFRLGLQLTAAAAAFVLFFSVHAGAEIAAPKHLMFIEGFNSKGDFSSPMGVFFDANRSEIYIADTGGGRICVFSNEGLPIIEYKYFKDVENFVKFVSPLSVAVDSEGTIFVSDTQYGRVIGMDFLGNLTIDIDLGKAESGKPSPGRIAIDSEDNLFIGDATNNQVLVYTNKGEFRYKFGKQIGNAGIESVNDIFPDRANSTIYVTSLAGPAVLIFDYDGRQSLSFGIHDSGEPNFSMPTGIVATADGTIYVSDMIRCDIKVFRSSGEYVMHFGGIGYGGNAIIYPADIALTPDGRLIFVEKTVPRVNVFSIAAEGEED